MCIVAAGFPPPQEEVQQRPNWFYPARHVLEHSHNTNTSIEFRSDGGAYLKLSLVEDPARPEQWDVEWRMTHMSGSETTGRAIFPRTVLLAAFGIVRPSRVAPCAAPLLQRFQADDAVLGRFIRSGSYLNIPGPGTGLPEDPNLSVLLTEDLVDRVRHFTGHPD